MGEFNVDSKGSKWSVMLKKKRFVYSNLITKLTILQYGAKCLIAPAVSSLKVASHERVVYRINTVLSRNRFRTYSLNKPLSTSRFGYREIGKLKIFRRLETSGVFCSRIRSRPYGIYYKSTPLGDTHYRIRHKQIT